jgi:hypothetical protein
VIVPAREIVTQRHWLLFRLRTFIFFVPKFFSVASPQPGDCPLGQNPRPPRPVYGMEP